jgi:hypothetical protein
MPAICPGKIYQESFRRCRTANSLASPCGTYQFLPEGVLLLTLPQRRSPRKEEDLA